jgi:hypothetical protein
MPYVALALANCLTGQHLKTTLALNDEMRMRSSRVVKTTECQCKSRNSPWVQSLHHPTQWNLRGGR